MIDRFNAMRFFVSQSLWQILPAARNDSWIKEMVDTPRFGWDWEALMQGYFDPLSAWAAVHNARLGPVFAGLLIDALGGDSQRHGDVLAALELHFLSAIMLDDMRNGRDVASSTGKQNSIPLPVWVTVAYNTRQLSVVLIARRTQSLKAEARRRLTHQFARFLFQQGVGSVLDLAGSENAKAHCTVEEFLTYLSLCSGIRSYGLAAHVASAACDLNIDDETMLASVANELGLALRLLTLSRGEDDFPVVECMVHEQPIHWRRGVMLKDLKKAAERVLPLALKHAYEINDQVGQLFSEFATFIHAPACKEGVA
jgi:hypothetical protein